MKQDSSQYSDPKDQQSQSPKTSYWFDTETINSFIDFVSNSLSTIYSLSYLDDYSETAEDDSCLVETTLSNDTSTVRSIYDPFEDICEQHQMHLARSISEKEKHIIRTIHTAIVQTNRTLALGSGNKIDDYDKTHGWSADSLLQREMYPLRYIKDPSTPNKWTLYECVPNRFMDAFLTQKHLIESDYSTMQNPAVLLNLAKIVAKLKRERVGNCADKSVLLAYYLWQSASKEINRIEIVKGNDQFDHYFVIINRKPGSDIDDSQTWGEQCWIADPWWGSQGTLYLASEYSSKSREILKYCIEQNSYLESKGMMFSGNTPKMQQLLADMIQYPEVMLYVDGILDINVRVTPYEPKPHELAYDEYYDFTPFRDEDYDTLLRLKENQKPQQLLLLRDILDYRNSRKKEASAPPKEHGVSTNQSSRGKL